MSSGPYARHRSFWLAHTRGQERQTELRKKNSDPSHSLYAERAVVMRTTICIRGQRGITDRPPAPLSTLTLPNEQSTRHGADRFPEDRRRPVRRGPTRPRNAVPPGPAHPRPTPRCRARDGQTRQDRSPARRPCGGVAGRVGYAERVPVWTGLDPRNQSGKGARAASSSPNLVCRH